MEFFCDGWRVEQLISTPAVEEGSLLVSMRLEVVLSRQLAELAGGPQISGGPQVAGGPRVAVGPQVACGAKPAGG